MYKQTCMEYVEANLQEDGKLHGETNKAQSFHLSVQTKVWGEHYIHYISVTWGHDFTSISQLSRNKFSTKISCKKGCTRPGMELLHEDVCQCVYTMCTHVLLIVFGQHMQIHRLFTHLWPFDPSKSLTGFYGCHALSTWNNSSEEAKQSNCYMTHFWDYLPNNVKCVDYFAYSTLKEMFDLLLWIYMTTRTTFSSQKGKKKNYCR